MSDYEIPYWIELGWVVICRDSISNIEKIEEDKVTETIGGIQIVMNNGDKFMFAIDSPAYKKALKLYHSGIAYSKRGLRKAKK